MTSAGQRCDPAYLMPTGDPARPLDQAGEEQLDREISRYVRRVLRQSAIASAGAGERHPAWSYTLHRVALGWLRNAGLDPMLAVGGERSDGGRAFRFLADQAGLGVGDLRVEDGRLDFSTITTGDRVQFVGRGRPALMVEIDIPETVVTAMPGRLLSEVLDHSCVHRAGSVRIEAADRSDGMVTIILRDTQEFLRRPPAGIDRRWRKIPFMPQPDDD